MRTLGVVIGDPPAKTSPQLRSGLEGVEIDALVLQGAPEPLDEDIVHPPASAIHADADFGVAQHAGEGVAGKLAALVRVEDFRLTEPGQRLLQRRDAEAGIHRVRQPPGQHLAGRPVHDRHQIEEATAHGDVRHVGAPHVIGPVDRQLAQQIRIDPVLRVRIARAWPLVDRRQAHLRHQPPRPDLSPCPDQHQRDEQEDEPGNAQPQRIGKHVRHMLFLVHRQARTLMQPLIPEKHGIPAEIIPGISSATALATLHQIPLTKRGITESVWITTGTTSCGELSEDIELAAQSTATVVILMGIGKLAEIVNLFTKYKTEHYPIAIIQNGTLSDEKIVCGHLSTIQQKAQEANISSPAVIIVGKVVDCSQILHIR